MQVHIARCNDQYGRWGMEALTCSCFMFLQASKPMDLRTWSGYTPKRGQLDNAFPADRLVVYSFGLNLPQAVSESGIRSKVVRLQLKQLQRGLDEADGEGSEREQQQEGRGQRVRRGMGGEGTEEGLWDMGFSVFEGVAVTSSR